MKLVTFEGCPHLILREQEDWGLKTYVLAAPPRRLWADKASAGAVVRTEIDPYATQRRKSPAELLTQLPEVDTWQAMSRRSIARFEAMTLLAEDPQRRLDAREVETLAHQVSLVRHILENPNLKRVLIADEVGLGKTVEVALIIKELTATNPGLRILYLAPARLVSNVGREFRKLGLRFREWKAQDSDANLETDDRIIASIHRAVHPSHIAKFKKSKPWDVVVVDECHHLSDWAPGGGDPVRKYRLVKELLDAQAEDSHAFLLSGTPHQANPHRFENLLQLLVSPKESASSIAGRVIFRTKDDVLDWDDQPLFPKRQVNSPIVCEVSPAHRSWLTAIHDFFSPSPGLTTEVRKRAAGWRCAQALQWATSSPNAGLGYLVRQAIRDGWLLENPILSEALAAMRPYRRGSTNEAIAELFIRIRKEVQRQEESGDVEDIEEEEPTEHMSAQERRLLEDLIAQGVALVRDPLQPKWESLWQHAIEDAGSEKIVLFAQPIETVLSLAGWLEKRTRQKPAIIIGGQSDEERDAEVAKFKSASGPQFLISSKAGGEGINLQFSRRLVHLDIPWNPMDMEQRIGRVHRFGSRNTILVDSLIVRDSREEQMWAVARTRLTTISRTMVSPERFEALFSRVMCLIAPEDLQQIMLASPTADIAAEDENRLASLVENGFKNWQNFHQKYAENQRQIRRIAAGLSRWEHLDEFLQRHAGAVRTTGVTVTRFRNEGGTIVPKEETATVLRFKNGQHGLIGDYEGNPLGGELASKVEKLGLNVPLVSEALRDAALPKEEAGGAHLRWGEADKQLKALLGKNIILFAMLRQRLQLEQTGGASELSMEIQFFYGAPGASTMPLPPELKSSILTALKGMAVRAKPADTSDLNEAIARERSIQESLFRPADSDLKERIRYAVWPLLAAHIIE